MSNQWHIYEEIDVFFAGFCYTTQKRMVEMSAAPAATTTTTINTLSINSFPFFVCLTANVKRVERF